MTTASCWQVTMDRDAVSRRTLKALSQMRGDLSLALLDVMMIVAAYTIMVVLRFDLSVPEIYWERYAFFLPLALAVHLTSMLAFGAYGQMWRHASVYEARRVFLAGCCTLALLLTISFGLFDERLPLSVIALGALFATFLSGVLRFHSRLFARKRATVAFGTRVAVVGAGDAGALLLTQMSRETEAGLHPVVVLDDDPSTHGRAVSGVPIVGGIDQLASTIERFGVSEVYIAIPSGGSDVVRRVAGEAERTGARVKVLPRLADLINDQVSVSDARELSIDDLLGREEVEINLEPIRTFLNGRVVLVTGGGGSIGAEIVRQVAEFGPELLVVLDHDETHLHNAAETLARSSPDVPVVQALVDIRNRECVDAVFGRYRPDVVFHSAAHKHVPLLESHAAEAASTNVLGTANVVEAARGADTERLLLISTDKAVRPSSVMGASKWFAEQVTLARSPGFGRFRAVRLGNVLGSRGSVIPTFKRQIQAGGPVTVTDARMTRFFVSITEAVRLVLEAAAQEDPGEICMLEMGEPVNIHDLARRMIRLSGYRAGTDIEILFTGVRDGEKLIEELTAPGETTFATSHPKIHGIRPMMLDPDTLAGCLVQMAELASANDDAGCREILLNQAMTATSTIDLSEPDLPGSDRADDLSYTAPGIAVPEEIH